MILRVNNLTKNYLGLAAITKLSFDVEAGTLVSFVGDNGAGKSTLMKCITGAIAPDFGRIYFAGMDLTGGPPTLSKQYGVEMVYQNLSLCKQQDVVTNIFLGRELHAGTFVDRFTMYSKCKEIFKYLDIDIPLSVPVGSLSGGQQQVVAIAKAVINDPKLLIMDEPTAALGVKEAKKILDLILMLKKKGITILMVTHRLADVFQVSDRIVVMSHGGIKDDLLPHETNLNKLISIIMS